MSTATWQTEHRGSQTMKIVSGTDALGNAMALTDENQAVTAVYQYDGWGNLLVGAEWRPIIEPLNNPVPATVDAVPNPYRWGGAWGYYTDEDAGMYLVRLRWYESFTGRFLTKDPIGFASGDANL